MAAWDYCRLKVNAAHPDGIPRWMGSSQNVSGKFTQDAPLDACLVVLGDDGWELVGILPAAGGVAHLIFKKAR